MKSEIHGRLAIDRQGRAVKLIFKNTTHQGRVKNAKKCNFLHLYFTSEVVLIDFFLL